MLKDFLEKAENIHNNFYDYSLVFYKNINTKIEILCPKHGSFEQTPKNHSHGHGCPKCALELKREKFSKSTQDFIIQSNIKHNYFYNYDKSNYINNRVKIIITCPTHGDFNSIPSHHLNGVGCSKCAGNYKRTNNEFIIESRKIHGNRYDYSLSEYKNNKSKIKIICLVHGEFEQKADHHLSGCGCPKCNSSKGENQIRDFLNKNNFSFKEQKRFDNCRNKKPLPFDFFLLEKNICIEFDGIHHYEPIRGLKQLNITRYNDEIKNTYCKNTNITLIRIKYTENIENILKTIKK